MTILLNVVLLAALGGFIYLWWQGKLPKSPKA